MCPFVRLSACASDFRCCAALVRNFTGNQIPFPGRPHEILISVTWRPHEERA